MAQRLDARMLMGFVTSLACWWCFSFTIGARISGPFDSVCRVPSDEVTTLMATIMVSANVNKWATIQDKKSDWPRLGLEIGLDKGFQDVEDRHSCK